MYLMIDDIVEAISYSAQIIFFSVLLAIFYSDNWFLRS
jgi:hypothetical protein